MYKELEDCDHLVKGLYDFAQEHSIPLSVVDQEIDKAYWDHKKQYDNMRRSSKNYDGRLRQMNVHVLEQHALTRLEKIAREKDGQKDRSRAQ
ncbi:hypothetical protein KY349_02475 [Candidatus Woesearchaeota archaeon]|nr:hypothetical protein [Candidatus Woesearchaeota archaeon]